MAESSSDKADGLVERTLARDRTGDRQQMRGDPRIAEHGCRKGSRAG
jgi:hypothetical protein